MHSVSAPRRLPILLFLAVAAFHFAVAWVSGPATNWHGQTSEYYQLLTDAFRTGQTSLLIRPSAAMLALPDPYDPRANAPFRLHDASLYHGKYYLYFGPTPAVVLFLPYRVLTGSHLPSRVAIGMFSAAGFACSCLFFFLLARREAWDCPRWLGSAAVLSLGTGTGVAFLLNRPSFYEVAISAGYCFAMAGFLLLARSLQPNSSPAWLAGSGTCFGLAVGCRPNLSVVAVLLFLLLARRLRSARSRWLAFAAPLALCGILLAAYNFARFQNPFEFGVRYQLLAERADLDQHFKHLSSNLLPGLYTLLLAPSLRWACWIFGSIGMAWSTPIALPGLGASGFLRLQGLAVSATLASTRFLVDCVYLSALAVLLPMAVLRFTLGRYNLDFAPEFLLLSWCLLAARWQLLRGAARRRTAFQLLLIGAALYSVALEILLCTLFHGDSSCR